MRLKARVRCPLKAKSLEVYIRRESYCRVRAGIDLNHGWSSSPHGRPLFLTEFGRKSVDEASCQEAVRGPIHCGPISLVLVESVSG